VAILYHASYIIARVASTFPFTTYCLRLRSQMGRDFAWFKNCEGHMPSENDPQALGLGSAKRRGRRKICRWSKSILVRWRHVAWRGGL